MGTPEERLTNFIELMHTQQTTQQAQIRAWAASHHLRQRIDVEQLVEAWKGGQYIAECEWVTVDKVWQVELTAAPHYTTISQDIGFLSKQNEVRGSCSTIRAHSRLFRCCSISFLWTLQPSYILQTLLDSITMLLRARCGTVVGVGWG